MSITLPPTETPLYNHPLPAIEAWLISKGCQQDEDDLHIWSVEYPNWKAELQMEVDALTVRYLNASEDGQDIMRSFKYSLSREDLENAIFAGP